MQNTTVTNVDIRKLRTAAAEHGDLKMDMICCLALDPDALDGAEPGTEADLLLRDGRTQEWARAECERVISEARARAEAISVGDRVTNPEDQDHDIGEVLQVRSGDALVAWEGAAIKTWHAIAGLELVRG